MSAGPMPERAARGWKPVLGVLIGVLIGVLEGLGFRVLGFRFHVFPVVCRYHALASSAERWCGTLVIRVLACKAVLYLASTRPDAKRV